MFRTNVVKGVLGVSALAALFAAVTVHAQSGTATQAGTSGHGAGTQQGSTGAAPGATATPAATSAPLSRADRKLLMDFAQANMAEIEASRIAQQKSPSEQVKNFAQQMIDDHTKALGDAQQLAKAKGITLPTELDRTHRARANRLEGLSGEAFDRAYLAQAGVSDNKKMHNMLRQGQSRTKDPELKALVARTLPVVSQHLNSATQLHKNTARGSSKMQGETGSSDRR